MSKLASRLMPKGVATPRKKVEFLSVALLFSFFIADAWWFQRIDFYHHYFFHTGAIVFIDNVMRIGFVLVLCWLIYVPGAGILDVIERQRRRGQIKGISPAERALMGFGIGIGVWHVVLFILGEFNLYYRWVMIALCAATLLASAKSFAGLGNQSFAAIKSRFQELRTGRRVMEAISFISVLLAATCLLLVRGLYPGGGGDYYTHYFYYYLDVLKNHGLAPNDVWYHYWYSKGYGLFFLSMLLTDPEAPALVTFCCVALATLAIALFAGRLAPRSLWPTVAALLYLFYNLVAVGHSGGGEFENDHELISALLVLVAWALCMEVVIRDRVFVLVAAVVGIAAAIVTQPMGILICILLSLLTALAALQKRWPAMLAHGQATAAVGGSVIVMFAVSFWVTGLATDQPLDFTLRFANIAKLDQLGLIPQIVTVAWIRDNYAAIAPSLDGALLRELGYFMRLDILWLYFSGLFVFALGVITMGRLRTLHPIDPSSPATSRYRTAPVRASAMRLLALVITLAVVSIAVGRVQYVTYERFSTFFFPLLALIGAAGSGWILVVSAPADAQGLGLYEVISRWLVPATLLFAVLTSWQMSDNWFNRSMHASINGLRFFSGQYSLADAYSRQDDGSSFGGINPEAFAAWQHAAPPAPIWATNVASFCMVPDCKVESVVSFELSPFFDEIFTASPEAEKKLLQNAGINYFLFLKDFRMVDILPYSKLFAPETIGRFLGIKWTDGSAYLLTWVGPETKPLSDGFYELYAKKLAEPSNPWFKFSRLAEQIATDTAVLRAKKWGAAPMFPWRTYSPAPGDVDVSEASYGRNCGVSAGNVTRQVREDCRDKRICSFRINVARLGDPASGCGKDFSVHYRCSRAERSTVLWIPPEANGHDVTLDCNKTRGIHVLTATYGESCRQFQLHAPRVNSVAEGNATIAMARICDGKPRCDFEVTTGVLGDPAVGCAKNFSVRYSCWPDDAAKTMDLDGEANGRAVTLSCAVSAVGKTVSP